MVTNNSNFATLLHNCTSKKSNILLTNLYLVTFATFLCTLFYLLGLWHHDPSAAAISATGYSVAGGGNGGSAVCLQLNDSAAATPSFAKLDFSARHYLPDPPPKVARGPHLPPCDPSLYEYTPCDRGGSRR